MFEANNFVEFLKLGGVTLYILVIVSILSVSVILFKFVEFWAKSRMSRKKFTTRISALIKQGRFGEAVEFCNKSISPMAAVARAGIVAITVRNTNITDAMDREIMIETVKLERFTTIIGTIGSISVYIGLLGTVLGIIRAFHDISAAGSGGISVVISGVAEALVATATGLLVAIPAVVAYNFFVKTIDKFVVNMEYCASAVEDAASSVSGRK
ncbi:MAG: MotA/TolQ/ExbB proton channel family protein [Elusimicrobiota bacterium]|jgi:biopolymer transport protein ExbB/TolQ|nr:MotA/TolQ/ExbB proton channel family protein [Elusimicrobiota bacterium]